MKRAVLFGTVTLAIVAVAGLTRISGGGQDDGDTDEGPLSIDARDIPEKIQIIGSLGYPLGELVTIQGVWEFPKGRPKDKRLHFRVIDVNGKAPNDTMIFQSWLVVQDPDVIDKVAPTPVKGAKWQLRGVELGGLRNLPPAARAELNERLGPSAGSKQTPRPPDFKFETEFRYISKDTTR
jgi:hypothetical protein